MTGDRRRDGFKIDRHTAPPRTVEKRHFGRDLWQRLAQEVHRAHPNLECAERMLDDLAAGAHGIMIEVKPLLRSLGHVLMHGLEFRAVDGNARLCEHAELAASLHGARADLSIAAPMSS